MEFNNLSTRLAELLSTLNKKDYSNLDEISLQARTLILDAKSPEKVSGEIIQYYHDLCRGRPIEVAVRSSATLEDLPMQVLPVSTSLMWMLKEMKTIDHNHASF